MTIEQMLKIEPNLKFVIDFAKFQNNEAKKRTIYFHDVWHECKLMMKNYIGWYAQKEELTSAECYMNFYDYLLSITKNTK
jgi:hypothetical protein